MVRISDDRRRKIKYRVRRKKRIAILISGRGSNMEALIRNAAARDYPATVVMVVSNRADAPGLRIAERYGVPSYVIDHTSFSSRQEFEREVDKLLVQARVELVCLAGFMRILSDFFIEKWSDKIVNIHPSLLPDYRGLDVHQRVFLNRERVSGCTVHFVKREVDFGPPIVQVRVGIQDCKSPSEIEKRVLAWEHMIYPLAVSLVCGGNIEIVNGEVRFAGSRGQTRPLKAGYPKPLIGINSAQFRRQIERISKWQWRKFGRSSAATTFVAARVAPL